jgi:hypothetical protein
MSPITPPPSASRVFTRSTIVPSVHQSACVMLNVLFTQRLRYKTQTNGDTDVEEHDATDTTGGACSRVMLDTKGDGTIN